jgi:hypothetical protein
MSNTNIDDLSREDLLRILNRDRFVKEQLSARVANLMHENLELLAIIQESRSSDGEVPTPEPVVDVTS